ncbi:MULTISPECIES: PilW family protein [unclassified Wenzhouxiangella]|uniref:PilW family protein n=1 Tax=unclassified Wenzhouxiangella TaxID=2613841 RepID=UPI000E326E07|nr:MULTISPECIES: prepilin-type N-terminal cleavage/methylation domain-containing protein [unclassified Wenzhouxiangella]RFF28296.1 type II secretion system protein [Wenzhouxiangella sp. 15181]RFP67779.1 type II secretion system protein [Wenzhouxiangella sp. 15190]
MGARGFSLIELILTITLIGILAMVSLPMLVSGFGAFSQQRETAAIEREAMLALERVAREIRMSRNFAISPDQSSISFDRLDDGGNLVNVTIERRGGELVIDREDSIGVLAAIDGEPQFISEPYENACYITAEFSTPDINEPWRVVTYTRNNSC